ncbi:glycerol-3-phosphate 1-O-acyltransferase PlsY [Flavisphingomonas formosensis]|uniref:glycerol-3-phosphate 1-O-acyltransferase PlsY n=1 Tax=Flavisphingomonas formosensis TaxID=861534 RepID=UPI0012FAF969|nr:glycerol-3-phosphate 1-O-acyltransferase PlsY [Sphingomonas formosensis]
MESTFWAGPVLAAVLGYLLGSIPFGLLLTRLAGAGNLREIGSGNIGATNVLRTGRKDLAGATLFLDGAKGAVAVFAALALWDWNCAMIAAAGAFIGHLYPVWLRFRGGKGVATFLGVALALHWPCGLIFAVIWILAALITRYSSVGGMAAGVSAPVAAAAFGMFDLALLFLAFTLMLLWKHRGNLDRLLAGAEPRIGGG